MDVTFVIAGNIRREYILPHAGPPLLDAPGGSALYACGGLRLWTGDVGVLARVGEDYPRSWLESIADRGVDVRGVKILPYSVDVREFIAYDARLEAIRGSPVSQFARRHLPFPKTLLGYQPLAEATEDPRHPAPLSPAISDIPADYRDARAVHLCPMDLASHTQLVATLRASGVNSLMLEPAESYSSPGHLQDLRQVLASLTTFLTSESKLRGLFWGRTYDLWEMLEAIGSYGCEIVAVRRTTGGQLLLDVSGRHRYEIPAYPSRPADPTGAVHAYAGGYLAGYKLTYDPLQAALYAGVSASLAVEGSGPFYPLTVLEGLADARLGQLRELVKAT